MRTTLELLIRLAELETATSKTNRSRPGKKATGLLLHRLVRDSLPPEVLPYYDTLLDQEPELLACPQVFAMAVLVSAYKGLSPNGRQKLISHFEIPGQQKLVYSQESRISAKRSNLGQKRCRVLAV